MEKYSKLVSFVSLILFVLVNYYFITLTIEMNDYIFEMDDLRLLLEDISYESMLNLIAVITNVLTTTSLLFQYLIGSFLLIIFVPEIKSKLFFALIPKIFIMLTNIVLMGIIQIHNSWVYIFTALLGSFLILIFFQYKKGNWKASILFTSPFIIDSLFSFFKEISSII